ncbi:hypothetical protein BH11BAC3_BH11BAC3_18380 [soil metagenome]
MNNTFDRVIGNRKFSFVEIEFGDQSGYHVDVKDENGIQWEFRMFHKDGPLKIEGEKLPDWIAGMENDLIKAINEHE